MTTDEFHSRLAFELQNRFSEDYAQQRLNALTVEGQESGGVRVSQKNIGLMMQAPPSERLVTAVADEVASTAPENETTSLMTESEEESLDQEVKKAQRKRHNFSL